MAAESSLDKERERETGGEERDKVFVGVFCSNPRGVTSLAFYRRCVSSPALERGKAIAVVFVGSANKTGAALGSVEVV